MSIAEVTARIAQIESQFEFMGVPAVNNVPVESMSSAQFARALGSLAGTSSTGGISGGEVVAEAKKYLGVRYVWGGTDPSTGLDCSGLVQLVFKNLGHQLPRLAGDQVNAGQRIASLADAKPGDLLGFGRPMHHVGIYLGDNMMIEAPRPGKNVRIAPVYETPSAIGRITTEATTGSGSIAGQSSSMRAPARYAPLFEAAARTYGVDPRLLTAVARQESGFNPTAVSPAGARGLMQLMPGTAKSLGVRDSFDPAQSINAAARLLHDLTQRFGRVDLALAAYNAGPGAVLKYNGIPPYAETQKYVATILADLRKVS